MAAGNHQGVVSPPPAAEPSAARRLWRVLRAVLYMLRRGLPSGRKLALDLHLLLRRGKLAGKALGDLFLAFHHHHHHRHAAAFSYTNGGAGVGGGPFSCRALDPTLAVHEPAPRTRREVEFSCSNTPSSTSRGLSLLGAGKRRRRSNRQSHQHHHHDESSASYLQCWNYDAAEVARVFEMLNDDDGQYGALFAGDEDGAAGSGATSAAATPSRMQMMFWAVAESCSPAVRSRTPRRVVTGESPAEAEGGVEVDRKADEFIRRFYEQLRAQRSAVSTPDYHGGYAGGGGVSPYVAPRGRRPAIAAGIA